MRYGNLSGTLWMGSAATTAYHARIPILAHLPGQRHGETYALLTSRVERGLSTCVLEVDVQLLILMIVNTKKLLPDKSRLGIEILRDCESEEIT